MNVLLHTQVSHRPIGFWLIQVNEREHCIYFNDRDEPIDGLISVWHIGELQTEADLRDYAMCCYVWGQHSTEIYLYSSKWKINEVRGFLASAGYEREIVPRFAI